MVRGMLGAMVKSGAVIFNQSPSHIQWHIDNLHPKLLIVCSLKVVVMLFCTNRNCTNLLLDMINYVKCRDLCDDGSIEFSVYTSNVC
jgi:hypothetical protein